MDRVETYVGQSVYEWLFSKQAQNDMVGLAKLSAAMLGTSTICNGLSCVPTGPASLQVVINPGEIYQLTSLEATVCGTLPQDTVHQVVKQGILLDAFTTASGALAAPASAGQSINYLIEAQYADSDVSIDPTTGTSPVVLQFYNSSNPTTPWSGPGGLGGTSNTFRKGNVSLQIKAGAAATTGSQVTPTPDSGWVGLWVVTVANGQTQILAGNITAYPGQPILPSSMVASIQSGNLSYAVATGTANAHVVALTPALQQRVDGMVIRYKAPAANTGALTLNDGLGAVAVVGGAHAALQGGETTTNGDVWVQWNSSIGGGSYVMLDSSGGALQIAPATQSQHAVQFGQVLGKQKLITSSQTFTVPTGVTTLYATVIPGGGGGGGGGSSVGSASTSGAGGGGGGGGAGAAYVKTAVTVAPGQVLTITIGAGGNGGAGSQAIATAASNGTAGGSTSVTGTSPTVNLTTTGGLGGNGGTNANGASTNTAAGGGAGVGGAASAGTFGVIGNGATYGGAGGSGASSLFGQGGGFSNVAGGQSPGAAGNNAVGYGAGGGGGGGGAAGATTNVEGGGVAGNGTGGCVLLEW